jgi:catechol 2,3-dioxygenase-like lactoylglutathione lyase family enzyme
MKIKLNGVLVGDQDKALRFYTEVLGFTKKKDIPVGEFRWLTVASPESPDDIELVLEPNEHPAAKTFQEAMFQYGRPSTAFEVDDIEAQYQRMKNMGVSFTKPPTKAGPITMAVFDDTCGNLIELYQPNAD